MTEWIWPKVLNMTEKSQQQTLTVELDQKTDEYDWNNKNKMNSLRRRTWTGKYDPNNKNEIKSIRRRTWMGKYDQNNLNFLILVIFTRLC